MTEEIQTDVQAAFEAGRQQIRVLHEEETDAEHLVFIARPDGDGTTAIEQFDLESYQERPRRAKADKGVRDVESFVAYLNRYQGNGTVIDAQRNGCLIGVINGHEPAAPGWGDHRVVLVREKTRGWAAWQRADEHEFGQREFAEFLEDRVPEITDPDGADLMELAEEFRAHSTLRFRSQKKLANGQTQIEYIEQIEGGTERSGQLAVPSEVRIRVQPYVDSEDVIEDALRLRWRMEGSAVKFRLVFPETVDERLDEIHDAAIESVIVQTHLPVFRVRRIAG